MSFKNNFQLLCRAFKEPGPICGIFVFVFSVLIWGVLYFLNPYLLDGYWKNLFVEFGGTILEIFFVAVILAVILACLEISREAVRQNEIIDDYKYWDSKEGNLRIAGAIRRLNKIDVHKINLPGIRLTDFSFLENDINNLAHSIIYNDKIWGYSFSEGKSKFERVRFDGVNCYSVVFSSLDLFTGMPGFEPLVKFIDCTFKGADLRNAIFNGASLKWSESPPHSHYYHDGYEEDGSPIRVPETVSPFNRVDLAGASFVEVVFENADFRDAENILEACFSGATGLDEAFFDDEKTRDAVLQNSKEPSN